jgi:hypothetical protein
MSDEDEVHECARCGLPGATVEQLLYERVQGRGRVERVIWCHEECGVNGSAVVVLPH